MPSTSPPLAAMAMSMAEAMSSVRMWSAMAKPTMRREPRSSTSARYSQPSSVGM